MFLKAEWFNVRGSVKDRAVFVASARADAAVRELARSQGLFIGWSAGAAVVAAHDLIASEEHDRSPVVVAIAPDAGRRYLSESRRRLEA